MGGIAQDEESDCYDCPAGKYTVGAARECQNCPEGKYSPGNMPCFTCPPGTTVVEGGGVNQASIANCVDCVVGKYSNSNGICTACPDGKTASGGGFLQVDCELCPVGKHTVASEGGGACVACPVGK